MNTQIESKDNHSLANMDYNFQDIEGERFICINSLEAIPFFVSMISAQDHWFFTATNGALSAGRGSPQNSLSLTTQLIKLSITLIAQARKLLLKLRIKFGSLLSHLVSEYFRLVARFTRV